MRDDLRNGCIYGVEKMISGDERVKETRVLKDYLPQCATTEGGAQRGTRENERGPGIISTRN